MDRDEADLIAKCKKGDIKSYELLYNRYSHNMYHTCLRIVGQPADAEDVLQDAFMDAFTNLDKLKDVRAFAGWLKRIVINKSLNHVGRHQRSWLELKTESAHFAEEEVLNEDEFEERIEDIKQALNLLGDKYRLVINLHVFEEMSFEEIAFLLKISSSTVRSQYLRGRQKILNAVGFKS